MTTKNSKSLSTFSRVKYTTVRLRSCISSFPPVSESSIKTVWNQSVKKLDFSRQRNHSPQKRAQYRSWGSLKMKVWGQFAFFFPARTSRPKGTPSAAHAFLLPKMVLDRVLHIISVRPTAHAATNPCCPSPCAPSGRRMMASEACPVLAALAASMTAFCSATLNFSNRSS